MNSIPTKPIDKFNLQKMIRIALSLTSISLFGVSFPAFGQPPQCDPAKTMTVDACGKCHTNEVQAWKQTPHFSTFQELSRRPRSKEICNKMGLRSVKRSSLCMDCHFTTKIHNGKPKAVSGISCESCHGASRDWIEIHNDYGGPTVTKAAESASHAAERLKRSSEQGMANTRNLYLIARNCLQCHTVPNEKLVNVGGHVAGSKDFELVAWSQGIVRHNFLRTEGQSNAASSRQRLRVMYVVGLIADLELSTRAIAKSTRKSRYGLEVANRAARVAVKLFEIQHEIKNADVQSVLESFAVAELRINNAKQLVEIANNIQQSGNHFAIANDGAQLMSVDKYLPDPATYK